MRGSFLAVMAVSTSVFAEDPCAKERAETGAWISQLAQQVDRAEVLLAPEQHLPKVSGPPLELPTGGTVSVTLTQSGSLVLGRPFPPAASAAELEKPFRESEAVMKDLHSAIKPAVPVEYVLVIDADVAWSRVVTVVSAAVKAGPRRISFVFADPAPVAAAPGPSSIDPQLAEIRGTSDFREKTDKLSAVSKGVFSGCAAILKTFGEPRESSDFGPMLLKLVERLPTCTCKFDLPAFRALVWTTFHVEPQTMARVDVAAKGRVVAAKDGEVWGTASAALVSAAGGKGPIQLALARK